MWEVFRIFCSKQQKEDDESSVQESHASRHFESVRDIAARSQKTLELLLLPQFIKYFKVSDVDNDYLDGCISRLAILNEVESYVASGITFRHLISELHESNFFMTLELTEQEPHSVFNAQVFMLILENVGLLLDDTDRMSGFFKDVNDLCENVEGRSAADYSRG